ncbi:MAG: hypothetical protein NT079_00870 [Candidatus Omnitrophica bacterium]|nr:hypothetical protein [Candidatus Omnitrophota bacterium]
MKREKAKEDIERQGKKDFTYMPYSDTSVRWFKAYADKDEHRFKIENTAAGGKRMIIEREVLPSSLTNLIKVLKEKKIIAYGNDEYTLKPVYKLVGPQKENYEVNLYLKNSENNVSEHPLIALTVYPGTKTVVFDSFNFDSAFEGFAFSKVGQVNLSKDDIALQVLTILSGSEVLGGFLAGGQLMTMQMEGYDENKRVRYDQKNDAYRKLKPSGKGDYLIAVDESARNRLKAIAGPNDQVISAEEFFVGSFFSDVRAASYFEDLQFSWIKQNIIEGTSEENSKGAQQALEALVRYYALGDEEALKQGNLSFQGRLKVASSTETSATSGPVSSEIVNPENAEISVGAVPKPEILSWEEIEGIFGAGIKECLKKEKPKNFIQELPGIAKEFWDDPKVKEAFDKTDVNATLELVRFLVRKDFGLKGLSSEDLLVAECRFVRRASR